MTVKSRYIDDEDITVTFGKRGPNQLPDFCNIVVGDDYLYSGYTDFHGPFICAATDDINGDSAVVAFTGGNHNYANDGSLDHSATARCVSLAYYADNIRLSDGNSGWFDFIRIEWVNRVQGWNTKRVGGSGREILEERHVLEYDGKIWRSYVEIEALEDITIDTYYGFQCVLNDYWNQVKLVGGNLSCAISRFENAASGNSLPNALVAYGDKHRIIMEIDRSFGLGTGNMYDGTNGCFVCGEKGYFWLIKDQLLFKGEIQYARASYKFEAVISSD